MPFCHIINWFFCHIAILLICCFVTLSFHQLGVLPICQFINFSFCQSANSSTSCFVNLPFINTYILLSICHFHHFAVCSSTCCFVNLPFINLLFFQYVNSSSCWLVYLTIHQLAILPIDHFINMLFFIHLFFQISGSFN